MSVCFSRTASRFAGSVCRNARYVSCAKYLNCQEQIWPASSLSAGFPCFMHTLALLAPPYVVTTLQEPFTLHLQPMP